MAHVLSKAIPLSYETFSLSFATQPRTIIDEYTRSDSCEILGNGFLVCFSPALFTAAAKTLRKKAIYIFPREQDI
jgi:hypothetical protein